MKSVIAQGSTVAKAIEEALKKAEMPVEFFVKLLEDAQSGFLGFGAKKAKVALFFKQPVSYRKGENVLSQHSYENLFDSESIRKQIEHQLKDLDVSASKQPALQQKQNNPKVQEPRAQQSRTHEPRVQTQKEQTPRTQESRTQGSRTEGPRNQAPRVDNSRTEDSRAQAPRENTPREQSQRAQNPKPMQRRELPVGSTHPQQRPLPSKEQQSRAEQTVTTDQIQPQDAQQASVQSVDENKSQRPNRNHRRRRRSGFRNPTEPKGPGISADKMVVRPLLPKNNNDSSKS